MQDFIAVFCVFISSILGASGSFFFKKSTINLKFNFKALLKNKFLFLGFVCFGLSTFVYLFGLFLSKLTILYPISSLSYVWSLFIGHFLLGEKITKLKIYGIIFILAGVSLVVLSI